ncbi:MAG: TetR/AcrR family transcriptional regulator [Candidatus Xenobiia bacterium LiM19]
MSARARSKATKDTIIKEAEKIFSEKGYSGTSIRDIAEASGISTSVLYYYFRDKQEIYTQILEQNFQELRAAITQTLLHGESKGDILKTFIAAHMKALYEHPVITRMVAWETAEWGQKGGGLTQKYFRENFLAIKSLLSFSAVKYTDKDMAAFSLMSMTGFFFFLAPTVMNILDKDRYDEDFLNRITEGVTELFLYGIKGERNE